MKKELSNEYRRRAQQALTETILLLSKEQSYSEDLQHKTIIAFCKEHIEYLNYMLDNNVFISKDEYLEVYNEIQKETNNY